MGLDLFRCIAICLVLLSHVTKGASGFGFFGVEMFFALSGYLIGGIIIRSLLNENLNFLNVRIFWARRWWRTLPNYYLFLLVHLLAHFWIGDFPSVSVLPSYVCFLQQTIEPTNRFFYGVSWSLCIEEWFYLLFPMILFTFRRLAGSKNSLLWTIFTFIAVSLLLRSSIDVDTELTRKITFLRLDAISYGVASIAIVNRFCPSFRTKLLGVATGFALLIVLYFYRSTTTLDAGFSRVVLYAIPAVAASACLPFIESVKEFPSRISSLQKPVTLISLWSYSIYLSHIPILHVTYQLLGNDGDSWAIKFLIKTLAIGLVIATSAIVYRFFESPLTKLRPKECPLSSL